MSVTSGWSRALATHAQHKQIIDVLRRCLFLALILCVCVCVSVCVFCICVRGVGGWVGGWVGVCVCVRLQFVDF